MSTSLQARSAQENTRSTFGFDRPDDECLLDRAYRGYDLYVSPKILLVHIPYRWKSPTIVIQTLAFFFLA